MERRPPRRSCARGRRRPARRSTSSAPPTRCATGPVHRRASARAKLRRCPATAARYRGVRGERPEDNAHRAGRLARAPAGRGGALRGRGAPGRARARARAPAQAARVPQGQGAGAARDPARGPRGDPRGGAARVAARLVLRRDRELRDRARRRPDRRPRLREPAAEGGGAALLDRDRRAAQGRARRVQGPRGRPRARRRSRTERDRGGARGRARAARAPGDRRARPPRPATSS